jgi:hypothetical protein
LRSRDDGDPGGEVVEEAAMLFRRPFGVIRSKRATPHGQRTGCGGDAGNQIVGARPYGGRTRDTMVCRNAGFIDCGRGAVGGRIGEITETKRQAAGPSLQKKAMGEHLRIAFVDDF